MRRAAEDDVPALAATLASAFGDYAWTRWTVDAEAEGERLRALLRGGAVSVTLPTGMPSGGVRLWDIRDPARPARRAIFRTEHAESYHLHGGNYSAHNPLALGRYALVSWFADGVRLLDLSEPEQPREVAAFVPEGGARVWGVARSGDLVLLSDVNSGLYVVRLEGLAAPP